jgi:carbohydrate kinase (thermoresistant glucokinase family)
VKLSPAGPGAAGASIVRPLRLVVMGVSGSGKSTIGRLLADTLGLRFVEGDELHPPRNVALMAAGTALTDEDRAEWLDALADQLAAAQSSGAVVTCSALRRRYRDRLRVAAPDLRLVYLHGDRACLAERMRRRSGHYMPASLLPSQLAALELPAADEHALVADIGRPPEQIVGEVCRRLTASPA